jgi:hypothetical protein
MARWWNRMPQYDGLFDYQGTVRPSYYAFKLLSRLTGGRLQLDSTDPEVHGFFTDDPMYLTRNLLLWNFSAKPVRVSIEADDVAGKLLMRPEVLDAESPSYDENARLRPLEAQTIPGGKLHLDVELGPWGVAFWSFEPSR